MEPGSFLPTIRSACVSNMAMRVFAWLPALFLALTGLGSTPSELTLVTDEAEAALHILQRREAGKAVEEASWRRLFASEGYRRLKAREVAMGRPFADSSFRAFLLSDTLLPRAAALRETLRAWRAADLDAAASKALAYLPGGTRLRARVYLLIKPARNSFVFETRTDPAIMLYLDPASTRQQLEGTISHELHHIGYAAACASAGGFAGDSTVAEARSWLGAFGEGVAMLAAAGGPEVHPHAVSPEEDRRRWDRDLGNAAADLRKVERFFLDILDHRWTHPDSARQAAMAFFGVQGPWYTIGWLMASTVERSDGRPALVESVCDPIRLLRRYNQAVKARQSGDAPLPLWSESLLARLAGQS
jgi:hypothetical protein